MPHYLLTGAGFTRNWGGPLSSEVAGSLLNELQNYPELTARLRKEPFEYAFQGFTSSSKKSAAQQALQDAVVGLFNRVNKALLDSQLSFEFSSPPVVGFRVMDFLAKFDAIFTLNQDLLIEGHYIENFGAKQGRWSGVGATRNERYHARRAAFWPAQSNMGTFEQLRMARHDATVRQATRIHQLESGAGTTDLNHGQPEVWRCRCVSSAEAVSRLFRIRA